MDELDNTIVLKDEAGMDVSFELLDLIEYQGNEYVVLLPTDESDDGPAEVVILKMESTEGSDEESYISVDDLGTLGAVFGIFKDKFLDEFSFME